VGKQSSSFSKRFLRVWGYAQVVECLPRSSNPVLKKKTKKQDFLKRLHIELPYDTCTTDVDTEIETEIETEVEIHQER
jgi:hypothetical protein